MGQIDSNTNDYQELDLLTPHYHASVIMVKKGFITSIITDDVQRMLTIVGIILPGFETADSLFIDWNTISNSDYPNHLKKSDYLFLALIFERS